MTLADAHPPGGGVVPADVEAVVYARGGNLSTGYLYPFALQQAAAITADGVTLSTVPGDPGFPYRNVVGGVGSTAADFRAGRFCIALQNVNDTEQGRVKIRGLVQAKVADSGNSSINFGKEMVGISRNSAVVNAPVASILDAKTATGTTGTYRKVLAVALEAYSTAPTSEGTTIWVDFDGWNGMGAAGEI